MRIISQIVRRATQASQLIERPKPRTRGKSPRARLREDALSMLA